MSYCTLLQWIQSGRVNSTFELGSILHRLHCNTIAFTVLEIAIMIRIHIIANPIFQFDVALYAKRYNIIQ